jgi:hypothetical protein
MVGSLVLIIRDGVAGGVEWTHHAGLSAAPLLLVAGALAAVSIAVPPRGYRWILRAVTVAAFVSWGLSQLFPDTRAAGLLDDAAILLFVIDAGCFVLFEVRSRRPLPSEANGRATESRLTGNRCCVEPAPAPCACAAGHRRGRVHMP